MLQFIVLFLCLSFRMQNLVKFRLQAIASYERNLAVTDVNINDCLQGWGIKVGVFSVIWVEVKNWDFLLSYRVEISFSVKLHTSRIWSW